MQRKLRQEGSVEVSTSGHESVSSFQDIHCLRAQTNCGKLLMGLLSHQKSKTDRKK